MTRARFKGYRRDTCSALLFALGLLGLVGCSDGDAQKSWSALGTCLAGSAAQSALPARVQQLRLIELGNSGALSKKDGWPGRCAAPANELYAALGSSSEG